MVFHQIKLQFLKICSLYDFTLSLFQIQILELRCKNTKVYFYHQTSWIFALTCNLALFLKISKWISFKFVILLFNFFEYTPVQQLGVLKGSIYCQPNKWS